MSRSFKTIQTRALAKLESNSDIKSYTLSRFSRKRWGKLGGRTIIGVIKRIHPGTEHLLRTYLLSSLKENEAEHTRDSSQTEIQKSIISSVYGDQTFFLRWVCMGTSKNSYLDIASCRRSSMPRDKALLIDERSPIVHFFHFIRVCLGSGDSFH